MRKSSKSDDLTEIRLLLLYWLIWLPLLSAEDLFRLLSAQDQHHRQIRTRKELDRQLRTMKYHDLIQAVMIHEPPWPRHQRYYVTDPGLHLYHTHLQASPSITIAQLARAYPIERDDLLTRLARPSVHIILTELVTRFIAEGQKYGFEVISYQQFWRLPGLRVGERKHHVQIEAMLFLEQKKDGQSAYCPFLVHVDIRHGYRPAKRLETFLMQMRGLYHDLHMHRQSCPALLILAQLDRLADWKNIVFWNTNPLLTPLLIGGLTTIENLQYGVYTPIWWSLATRTTGEDLRKETQISLHQVLDQPILREGKEQFFRQEHFLKLLQTETGQPPHKIGRQLKRYVGDALRIEAAHLKATRIEEGLSTHKKDQQSLITAGLLSLHLTPQQKEILFWLARHPLLDILTLQALVRPKARENDIRVTQRHLTHLFQLRLVETKLWPEGKNTQERQRYVLTPAALRFVAIQQGEPYSTYFQPSKQQLEQDKKWTQWEVAGLFHQMHHTHGLYTCIRQIIVLTKEHEGAILDWKSAHEAARASQGLFRQKVEHIRPDAELLFKAEPEATEQIIFLEYDRGTTDKEDYRRKFQAYLDYKKTVGKPLSLILMVTPHNKAAQMIGQVLTELKEPLSVLIVLEENLLIYGLKEILRLQS